jgi:hypothetical protein
LLFSLPVKLIAIVMVCAWPRKAGAFDAFRPGLLPPARRKPLPVPGIQARDSGSNPISRSGRARFPGFPASAASQPGSPNTPARRTEGKERPEHPIHLNLLVL